MLDHACSRTYRCDGKVVISGHHLDGLGINEVWSGQEELHGIKTQFCSFGEALGQRLMKYEWSGLCFWHLGESDR